MYDIHSHIIYGIDDGSPNKESSVSLLQMAAACGTSHIVATPHVVEICNHPSWERINDGVQELRSMAVENGLDLRIIPGAEVMLSLDILSVYDEAPHAFCLNNTNYALIELPRFEVPRYTENAIYEMQLRGLTPILAHPECYDSLFKTPDRLLEWCHKGVLLQCDLGSLTGMYGPSAERNLRFMFHNRLISFIGSDAHRVKIRNTDLTEGRKKLLEIVDGNYAETICVHNPRTMLAGEPVAVDFPMQLEDLPDEKKSFWRRLLS